ncbi:hypothetical protein HYV70_01965 [Candidatus Uhrbacteria bacterium]|nr:hypothetical protein [Candidatus Uhrbacteria bacterium]
MESFNTFPPGGHEHQPSLNPEELKKLGIEIKGYGDDNEEEEEDPEKDFRKKLSLKPDELSLEDEVEDEDESEEEQEEEQTLSPTENASLDDDTELIHEGSRVDEISTDDAQNFL